MLLQHFIYSCDIDIINSLVNDIQTNNLYFVIPVWDQICLDLFWCNVNGRDMVHTAHTRKKWLSQHPDIELYLKIRYKDSDSVAETIYRIANNIEERPHCQYKNCHGHVEYHPTRKYRKFCCYQHAQLAEQTRKKIETTTIKKYGVRVTSQADCVKETARKNNLKKYGKEWPMQRDEVKAKSVETFQRKYGCNTISQCKKLQEKYKQRYFEKHGVYYPMQTDKAKQHLKETMLKLYGVPFYSQTEEYKEKIRQKQAEINQKIYDTKKRNKTFCSSAPEEKIYKILTTAFGTDAIKREYKTVQYPFSCDFYIKPLNLFIEYQGTWMHGYHPYNPDNKKDQETLNYWKTKSDRSQYCYAILYWSVRDPKKRKTAANNSLRYLEIFPSFNLENLPELILQEFSDLSVIKQMITGEK